MTADIEYIQRFFEGQFSPAEVSSFEKRIAEDPAFAEDVAFYVTSIQAAADIATAERRQRFKSFSAPAAPVVKMPARSFRRSLPWLAAAAAVAAIVIGLFLFRPNTSPSQVASNYLRSHVATLSTTMADHKTTMAAGVEMYNHGRFAEALNTFQKAVTEDKTDPKAQENAGLAALQLGQYDKALQYFVSLENDHSLYANPGRFYHALTLLKRNFAGDPDEAKKLLQDVVTNHLDLDKEAADLLKEL